MEDNAGNMKDLQKSEKHSHNKEYIIPPGLTGGISEFEDHYKVAEGEPILITGPTGVGKTLFLRIFERLFEEEYKQEKVKRPVVWANCAHFGGRASDPNVARVELFGSIKGVISGVGPRKGLVASANNGVLILEEIGELPLEVQAMLLTFIETKQYRKVGSTNIEESECRIVAATNREEALREDFRFRFFPFYVPSLYERRGDVLYYLYSKWPALVKSLSKYEVLTLLAHNWPGNVRELERVARLLRRYGKLEQRIRLDEPWKRAMFNAFRMHKLDMRDTSLRGEVSIYDELEKRNADVEFLESLLNKHRVGLSDSGENYAFQDLPDEVPGDIHERYGIKILKSVKQFEQAYHGFEVYCALFFQNSWDNKNVLKDLREGSVQPSPITAKDYGKKNEGKFYKLSRSIFEYLSGISLGTSFQWPRNFYDLERFLNELAETHPSNRFIASALGRSIREGESTSENLEKIWSLSEKDLLRLYYEGLLRKTGGNVNLASDLAKENKSTLRSRLKKLGIRYGKTETKTEK
jgi:DNA-binding NtrC family response regulator